MSKRRISSALSCLCVVLSFGCEPDEEEVVVSLEDNLGPPAAVRDGWPVSELELEGVQGEPIRDLVRQLQADPQGVDSFLVVRNGKLVLDSYYGGWGRNRLHELRSVSKSVNSLLVGIAVDQGALDSVQHPVLDLFPEYAALGSPEKAAMRVEHLLTMSSGLSWNMRDFDHEDDRNNEGALERSDDWLGYVLGREMQDVPGEVFLYSSGNSALLAGVVKQTMGVHSDVVAEQYLFGPLGIQDYYWDRQEDGLCNAWAGLSLRSRDMAKIGQLMLDGGRWEGQQIVSEDWVERSTAPLQPVENGIYGYQWWTDQVTVGGAAAVDDAAVEMAADGTAAVGSAEKATAAEGGTFRVHSARGNGGQFIYIVPALNAVVVFTGSNYFPLDSGAPFRYLTNIVLPALL